MLGRKLRGFTRRDIIRQTTEDPMRGRSRREYSLRERDERCESRGKDPLKVALEDEAGRPRVRRVKAAERRQL